jgi:ketosteroid isomerase-like protein
MTSRNKDIVIGLWRAFAARDPDGIRRHLAEDAVWRAPADNATAKFLGMSSGMRGREEIVRFIVEQFPSMFARDVKAETKGVYADGDIVVLEMTLQATLANGRPYRNDYCFICDLRDGWVVEIREFMDTYNGHRMTFGQAAVI